MVIFSIQFHVNASMKNLLEGPLKLVYFLHCFLRKLTLGHSRSLEMNLKPPIIHCYECRECSCIYYVFPCLLDVCQKLLIV